MDAGMTFPMDSQAKPQTADKPVKISREQMLADADQLLAEFASDYKGMAE